MHARFASVAACALLLHTFVPAATQMGSEFACGLLALLLALEEGAVCEALPLAGAMKLAASDTESESETTAGEQRHSEAIARQSKSAGIASSTIPAYHCSGNYRVFCLASKEKTRLCATPTSGPIRVPAKPGQGLTNMETNYPSRFEIFMPALRKRASGGVV